MRAITLVLIFLSFTFGAVAQTDKGELEFDKAAMYYEQEKYPEALSWYKKAAAKGNIEAMEMLVEMYTEGQGTPVNKTQAKNWQNKADKAQEKANLKETQEEDDEDNPKKSRRKSVKKEKDEEEEE
jgi:uncharacterized protein YdaT